MRLIFYNESIYKNYTKMSSSKKSKQVSLQTPSLSTFNRTQNTESTKKAISTQEISLQSHPSQLSQSSLSHSSQFSQFSSHHNLIVPFQCNIKSLIKHLLLKLQEKGIIILHSDQHEGEILIQKKKNKNCWTSLLDCLCLCKKEGWDKGSITQSFEAVSILIKRQYIEYQCKVKVRMNCPCEKASPQLLHFVLQIVDFIKKCLQSFKDIQQQCIRFDVNEQSPLAMEIAAHEKAYNLFIGNVNEDKRYRTLFNSSLQKMRNEIQYYKSEHNIKSNLSSLFKKENSQGQNSGKKLEEEQKSPKKSDKISEVGVRKTNTKEKAPISAIMNTIITETNNIYQFCRQMNQISLPQFHHDYALYSIEALFCYNILPELFQLYKIGIQDECEQFYKNSEYINKNLTSKQYFDYLEVRPKFRLQSSSQPYDLAINALRQLETSLSLREVLLCMQKTYSLIKVCCLYEHDGKLDIATMDDILPVMIYVVAKAQVIDFPVYVKIIDDYVKIRGVFELQERVTTTLYVATEDISKKLPSFNSQ